MQSSLIWRRGYAWIIRSALLPALVNLPALGAEVTSTWKAGNSGYWTTTANWNTQPYFPNNAYPSAVSEYAVVINAVGNYTVTLGTRNITVDSLLINAADPAYRLKLSKGSSISSMR